MLDFVNAFAKHPDRIDYRTAAARLWCCITHSLTDPRPSGEWFWQLDETGTPDRKKPTVEPWKCPYHKGRMCLELIRRDSDVYV